MLKRQDEITSGAAFALRELHRDEEKRGKAVEWWPVGRIRRLDAKIRNEDTSAISQSLQYLAAAGMVREKDGRYRMTDLLRSIMGETR